MISSIAVLVNLVEFRVGILYYDLSFFENEIFDWLVGFGFRHFSLMT